MYVIRILVAFALAFIISACNDEPIGVEGPDSTDPPAPEDYYAISQKLFRSYGVGYGYDATGGYAKGNEVKDRILSLLDILEYEKNNHVSIFVDDNQARAVSNTLIGHSLKELAESFTIKATLDVNLILFSGHLEKSFSTKVEQSNAYSYATILYDYVVGRRHVDPFLLASLVVENPQILTKSFRSYCDKLTNLVNSNASSQEIYAVCQEFVNLFGTHFIYHSDIGGRLEFNSAINKNVLTKTTIEKAVASMFAVSVGNSATEEEIRVYQEVKNQCSYSLSARGGDVDILMEILQSCVSGNMDNTAMERWINSISFDSNWGGSGNSEMADFKLFPIEYFIKDERAREYLTFTIKSLINESWNNFKTSYNPLYIFLNPSDIEALATFGEVRVLSSDNKKFAEVTEEHILYNGEINEFATIYPIINDMPVTEGFAINSNKLYSIRWSQSACQLKEICDITSDVKLYYSNGLFSLDKYGGNTYSGEYLPELLTYYFWDDYYSTIYKAGAYLLLFGPKVQMELLKPNYYESVITDSPMGWIMPDKKFAEDVILSTIRKYKSYTPKYYTFYIGFEDGECSILTITPSGGSVQTFPHGHDTKNRVLYYRPIGFSY